MQVPSGNSNTKSNNTSSKSSNNTNSNTKIKNSITQRQKKFAAFNINDALPSHGVKHT
jgi:hypothetical protein